MWVYKGSVYKGGVPALGAKGNIQHTQCPHQWYDGFVGKDAQRLSRRSKEPPEAETYEPNLNSFSSPFLSYSQSRVKQVCAL